MRMTQYMKFWVNSKYTSGNICYLLMKYPVLLKTRVNYPFGVIRESKTAICDFFGEFLEFNEKKRFC